jgi:AGCS family alanine or glycine:cation symporter
VEAFSQFAAALSGWVWGLPLIALLMGTHVYLTIRTGGIQRYLPRGIRLSVSRHADGVGQISGFSSLMTALAATIGTGNIIGVAGAISAGGPGAVFWMWLTGIFGIATKYCESLLAVKYRVEREDGSVAGGPMYVLERGLGRKWLGVLFAVFTAIAAFGIGNMTQSNSIVEMILTHVPPASAQTARWIAALALAGATGLVVLGGVRSIAKVCSLLVPVMAALYVGGCALVLIKNYALIPEAIAEILKGAFSGHAAVGGFVGATLKQAIQMGVARGLFSNESGLGSAPIVAAAARTRNPVQQALVSATGTFWDTVVVCLMTGLVLVTSGHWKDNLPKAALTQAAFGELHAFGPWILLFGLLTFVFSTILGWSYYGEKAVEYLAGPRSVVPYRLLWVAAVAFGGVQSAQAVWDFADAANGLMAIPNLIALLALSPVVVAETKAHAYELQDEAR